MSQVNAAEVICTVDQVGRFSNRVHVRCLESYQNTSGRLTIKYFAAPTSDVALSDDLFNLGNQANIPSDTSNLLVTYDPNNTNGTDFDCRTANCREISSVRLLPIGRRVEMNISDIEGEMRRAIIYPPRISSGPHPVVLFFHGGGGTADASAGVIGLHNLWRDAFVVYGQGSNVDAAGRPSTRSGWDWTATSWARHTLDELVYRNYGPYRRVTYWRQNWMYTPGPSDDPQAATVQFILHPGGHSWPSDASGWVVGFLQNYSR